LTGNATLNGRVLKNWLHFSLPFNDTDSLALVSKSHSKTHSPKGTLGIYTGSFTTGRNQTELADTFLSMEGWSKVSTTCEELFVYPKTDSHLYIGSLSRASSSLMNIILDATGHCKVLKSRSMCRNIFCSRGRSKTGSLSSNKKSRLALRTSQRVSSISLVILYLMD